ncbi:hypothetical protein HELRODRAFT_163650 [Helobdella robusta]|uniref:E2 domain-containing protein n=1 Tax=Helobdella robusta TaxID=6412 RepID=T1EUB5_HELRO|nr:hypothetical protein HELRODRAFT_163650 [Helobdella robusta]ESN96573.1 hypothetical protein HELRODRAFT_163650 [Helobdella robusta]
MKIKEQKKVALENYLKSLNDVPIKVPYVLTTLKRYIKSEQRDRNYVIESIKEQKKLHPEMPASGLDDKIDEKLREIDQAVDEALEMLEKIPKHGKKMRQHIDDFITKLPTVAQPNFEKSITPSLFSSSSLLSSSSILTSSSSLSSSPSGLENKSETDIHGLVTSSWQMSNDGAHLDHVLDDVMYKHEPVAGHMMKNEMNVEQPRYRRVQPIGSGDSNGNMYMRHRDEKLTNPIGIILTSIGLVLIIVIGIIALIKRVNSVPVTNGYLDKPLKRGEAFKRTTSIAGGSTAVKSGGVQSRQNSVNGYENPTYRYYEATRVAVS